MGFLSGRTYPVGATSATENSPTDFWDIAELTQPFQCSSHIRIIDR